MTDTTNHQWPAFAARLGAAGVLLAGGMIAKQLLNDANVFNDVWAAFLVLASVPVLIGIGHGQWARTPYERDITRRAAMVGGLFTVIAAAIANMAYQSVLFAHAAGAARDAVSPLVLPGIAALAMVFTRQMLTWKRNWHQGWTLNR